MIKLTALTLLLVSMLTMTPAIAENITMREVTDTSGNTISIPAKPQRIAIAADRAFTEPFVAAGFMPIAVASQHEFAPFLQDALQQATELNDLGHHREIDIEALIAAKPDLIIMRNIRKLGNPALYEKAVKIAPVVQLDSTVGLRELIDDIGAIMGKPIADKLHQRVNKAVQKMQNAVADPSQIRISHGAVYPGELSLFKDNSNTAAQLIKEAGYARPRAQQANTDDIINESTKFSLEQLYLLDGDVLFLNQTGDEKAIATMLSSNLWQTLSVVQKQAVVTSDWRYWNVGGPIAAELIAEDFVRGLQQAGLASDSATN